MKKVSAIIMASGLSRRMGSNKLLLPVEIEGRKTTLIENTIRVLSRCHLFEIICVSGYDEILSLAAENGFAAIRNEHPEHGISESIRLGTAAASGDFYMFTPSDQPFLDEETILDLIGHATERRIVRPALCGSPGSPTVFCSSFRSDLLRLEGDNGGRDIYLKYPQNVDVVEVLNSKALVDIDTAEDIKMLSL